MLGQRYLIAAARVLMAHTELAPAEICREAMSIAASLCVYTNKEIVVEEL
jgi:ATP-dependent HslUV protease subunit HslV